MIIIEIRVLCIFAQKYTLRGAEYCLRFESNCDLDQALRHLNQDAVQDTLINDLNFYGGQLDDNELKKIIAQIRAILELSNHS